MLVRCKHGKYSPSTFKIRPGYAGGKFADFTKEFVMCQKTENECPYNGCKLYKERKTPYLKENESLKAEIAMLNYKLSELKNTIKDTLKKL